MRVTLSVNGAPRRADGVWEGEILRYVRRERLGLPGSKNACEQGECGSCTVYLDGAPVCAVARLAATGTAVAHCPCSNARLGAGVAPVRELLEAGAPVGLGVDGPASQEAGQLGAELRHALLAARIRGGAAALTAREAPRLGTMGGARCIGRADDIGSLERG